LLLTVWLGRSIPLELGRTAGSELAFLTLSGIKEKGRTADISVKPRGEEFSQEVVRQCRGKEFCMLGDLKYKGS
jgi:hypothetical protein